MRSARRLRTRQQLPAVFFGVASSGQGDENPPPTVLPTGVDADTARVRNDASGAETHWNTSAARGSRRRGDHLSRDPGEPVHRAGGLTGDLDASEAQGVTRCSTTPRPRRRMPAATRPAVRVQPGRRGRHPRGRDRDHAGDQAYVVVALLGNPSYPRVLSATKATRQRRGCGRRSGTQHSHCPGASAAAPST